MPSNVAWSVILQAFHSPPHVSADQEKLHLICPVWTLGAYVRRSLCWRKSDQLLVCFGSLRKGSPASKHTIRWWIVETIYSAYEACSLPSLLLIRAHSTRELASSKALLSGVSLQEVCNAAGWAFPHTFISITAWICPPQRFLKSLRPELCQTSFTPGQTLVIVVQWVCRSPKCRLRRSASYLERERLRLRR